MCDGVELILWKLGAQTRVQWNLIYARALTVVKKRRDYKLQVESYGVFGVAAVLMGQA